jgi:hypothetical protein
MSIPKNKSIFSILCERWRISKKYLGDYLMKTMKIPDFCRHRPGKNESKESTTRLFRD